MKYIVSFETNNGRRNTRAFDTREAAELAENIMESILPFSEMFVLEVAERICVLCGRDISHRNMKNDVCEECEEKKLKEDLKNR